MTMQGGKFVPAALAGVVVAVIAVAAIVTIGATQDGHADRKEAPAGISTRKGGEISGGSPIASAPSNSRPASGNTSDGGEEAQPPTNSAPTGIGPASEQAKPEVPFDPGNPLLGGFPVLITPDESRIRPRLNEKDRVHDSTGVWVDPERVRELRASWPYVTEPRGLVRADINVREFDGRAEPDGTITARMIRVSDGECWQLTSKMKDPPRADGFRHFRFFVPVSAGDSYQFQVEDAQGRRARGHMPYPSLAHTGVQSNRLFHRRGEARLELRLVGPDQNPRARTVLVVNENGQPVADVTLTQEAQEWGRSDTRGIIEWPFPPISRYQEPGDKFVRSPDGKSMMRVPSGDPPIPPRHELGFILHAAGYVPIIIPREEVADAGAGPLTIKLKAREFVVSVSTPPVDERYLWLGDLTQQGRVNGESISWPMSEILRAGWDLMPLAPETSLKTWEEVYHHLTRRGQSFEAWRAMSAADALSPGYEYGRIRDQPFRPGDSDNSTDTYADGLIEATGRPYHKIWPDYYGAWYNGRWRYESGRFDVVLPYPGKFLLLVGEEYREGMRHSKPGQLTHVLYINALDPKAAKGELIRCPD